MYDELNEDKYRYVEWRYTEEESGKAIVYDRVELIAGSVSMFNIERDNVESTDVMGYAAKIYIKNDVESYNSEVGIEYEIVWNDEKYSYTITSIMIDDAENVIKRMAESVYKKI